MDDMKLVAAYLEVGGEFSVRPCSYDLMREYNKRLEVEKTMTNESRRKEILSQLETVLLNDKVLYLYRYKISLKNHSYKDIPTETLKLVVEYLDAGGVCYTQGNEILLKNEYNKRLEEEKITMNPMDNLYGNETEELRAKVKSANERCDYWQKDSGKNHDALIAERKKTSELEIELEKTKKEKEEYCKNHESAQTELERLSLYSDAYSDVIDVLCETNIRHNKTIVDLTEEKNLLETELANLKELYKDSLPGNIAIKQSQEYHQQILSLNFEIQSANKNCVEYADRYDRLVEEKELLKTSIENLNKTIASMRWDLEQLESNKKALNTTVDILRSESEARRRRIVELEVVLAPWRKKAPNGLGNDYAIVDSSIDNKKLMDDLAARVEKIEGFFRNNEGWV